MCSMVVSWRVFDMGQVDMRTRVLSRAVLCAGIAAAALSMATLVPSGAIASTLTVDRGLPTDNLNNAAGSDRSNVAWAFGHDNTGSYWVADTFSLAAASSIDDLRLWVTTSQNSAFGDTYNDLSLYLGSSSSSTINNVATASFSGGSSTSSNPNVSVSQVTYTGGASYQNSSGTYSQIWQIDFTNLGAYAAGTYMFAITGPNGNSPDPYTFVHASNAALGGAPADGTDNLMYAFVGPDGAPSLTFDSNFDSNGNGWDKSSDLNVQVFTSTTPIPATLPLFLTGIGLLGLMVYRRKKAADPAGCLAAA